MRVYCSTCNVPVEHCDCLVPVDSEAAGAIRAQARREALEEAARVVEQADRDSATHGWVLEQLRAIARKDGGA